MTSNTVAGRFDAVDLAIVQAVGDRPRSFSDMPANVWEEARKASPQRGHDRTVDARLQALRKRGLVAFKGGRWFIPTT